MAATMREIVLKTVKSEDASFTYAAQIVQILKTKNGQGMDYAEMELVMPVIRAVKNAEPVECGNPKALITEEQFAKLVECVTSFKGYIACEENSQFVKDIKESKSVEVAPVQGS